jgi:hypothetical protein
MSTHVRTTRLFGLTPRACRSRTARRPRLELLEDRLAPATLTVNSTADTASDSDSYLSLREAVAIVNSPRLPTDLSAQILAQISGPLHGGATDLIGFDPTAVTGPITLVSGQLELTLQADTAVVTIDGGATGVTVDGNRTSVVFQIDLGADVALNHLTMTHGNDPVNGGAIYNAGTLTLTNSTLAANTARNGGGIFNNAGTVAASRCTFSGDYSTFQGGGIYNNQGLMTLTDSTLVGNQTNASNGSGGGIYNTGGTLTVSNSTLSGNSANYGGGIYSDFNSTLTVTSSTLSSNIAGYFGGGISGSVQRMEDTLVAGNQANYTLALGPDINGNVADGSNNLVGIGDSNLTGISNGLGGNLVGTTLVPLDPQIGPLANNGGPTFTRAVLAGSLARGAGTTAGAPATDQRGLPRVVGGEIDIGAYQSQGPVAGPQLEVSQPNGVIDPPVDQVRVTFNHPLDPTTFIPAQANLTGPAGTIPLDAVTAVPGSDGQEFDLSFASQSQPGGYALTLSSEVVDVYGTPFATSSLHLFTVRGLPGCVLTVNSTADTANPTDPYLSLREAIALVNSASLPSGLSPQILAQIQGTLHNDGTDQIVFDPAGVTGPIVLTGGRLELSLRQTTAGIVIDGGTAGVTLDGNNRSQVLQIGSGVDAVVDHLTIRHGSGGSGSGIYNAGTLTLSHSTLSANSNGVGVYNQGLATVSDCTISGNSGGGLVNSVSASLTVASSILSGNTSGDYGGGIANSDGGTLTVTGCTLFGNSTNTGGGGISTGNYSTLTLSNSTLFDNTVGSYGGGLYAETGFSSRVSVADCTISSNSVTRYGGGGIFASGSGLLLKNTIVAGNLSGNGGFLDVSATLDSTSSNNLIGIGDRGLSGISNGRGGNLVGNSGYPIDPRLGPLADNGGPTLTQAVLADSPARGAGSTTGAPATDQRGLPRVVGGEIDIGAYQTQGPVAGARVVLSAPGGVTNPPVDHVQLTFNHPLDPASVTTADVRLTGPGGPIALTAVAAVPSSGGQQFDLSFAAQSRPGDYYLAADSAVRDVYGNSLDAPSSRLFSLPGAGGCILTVNSTADTANPNDPYLTLREAIAIVNSPSLPSGLSPEILRQISGTLHSGGSDTIAFDPAAVTGPIILGGSQLELSSPVSTAVVTIDGGSAGATVDGNDASRVLQIDVGVEAAVNHLTVTHGMVQGFLSEGGGIMNTGTLTLTGSILSGNSAYAGGDLGNEGLLTVSACTLSAGSASSGGGLYNGDRGTMMVSNCTLTGNSGSSFGGGINDSFGTLTVSNTTLSSNSSAQGGGIYVSGPVTVSSSTLSANSGHQGGGIFIFGTVLEASLVLHNTIVAGNSSPPGAGPDIDGRVQTSSGYNLVGVGDSTLSGISDGSRGNRVGTVASPIDPRLAPLDWYGGPTQTFALLPGSPALAHGDPVSPGSTDQRGLPRPAGGPTDIGAFQSQADPFLVTTRLDPGRVSGLLSLREAVALANVLPGDNTVSFDPNLDGGAITLAGGQLELSGTGGVQTIDGQDRITLDGGGATRLLQVDAGTSAVVRGFALLDGYAGWGAGVYNQGTLTVADCVLYGNTAYAGGAILNQGGLTLYGSTLAFNAATLGGAIDNEGMLTAFNSTIGYNAALSSGGALLNQPTGTAILTSLTISLNSAEEGGGLDAAGGSVLLRNCIVAGNTNADASAASDISGTVGSGSTYNLIGTGGSGGLLDGMNHNLVGVADPGLTPPDFSSNQTPAFGLSSDSPALAAGDPTLLSDPLLSLDQHGNLRSNPPDIGAV